MILMVGLLASCAGKAPLVNDVIIYKTMYPEMPPIAKPSKLSLATPLYDYPRDTDAELTVKNLTDCLKVEEDKRNNSFWRKCGEYPHKGNSNIYLGYDLDNWNMVVLNMAKIKAQLNAWNDTIDELNKQRALWIEENKTTTNKE